MEQMQIFENTDFGEIRTINIDNEPWFVGKDIATALRYTNPQKAIRDHVDDEDKTVNESFTVNGTQGILINESGLYSLVLSSKLPSAKTFKRWVTSEVLPSLRKTGMYQMEGVSKELQAIIMQDRKLQIIEQKVENLENNMTLDYAQQQSIGKAVNNIVLKALGGKNSLAYSELSRKVFSECNRDIKDYFRVNARNNIPKARYLDALAYIDGWQPSTNTKISIQECNAQLSLERG